MTPRLPFNKRDRHRFTQNGLGHRPVNCWGSGDLPAPWAEGDIVRVPEGAKALERMRGMGPGVYVVCYATSIDEGDAWYFRVTADDIDGSDRLHVVGSGGTEWQPGHAVDWMAGVELVDTADPDGLALRTKMLADGWRYEAAPLCPTCHRVMPKAMHEAVS